MTDHPFQKMMHGEHRYMVTEADDSVDEHEPFMGMYGLCDEDTGGIVGWFMDMGYAIQLANVLNNVWLLSHSNTLLTKDINRMSANKR